MEKGLRAPGSVRCLGGRCGVVGLRVLRVYEEKYR